MQETGDWRSRGVVVGSKVLNEVRIRTVVAASGNGSTGGVNMRTI